MKNILLPLLSSASQFEQVLKIIDIVWLVAFIAVLVLLGLMFLRGFFRGWKYGTYRLIFLGILIAVALVTLGSLSNFAGNLDVSGFGLPALTVEVKEGTTITSTWTTPLATLTDFFDKFLKANGVTSDASAVLSYAFALALSVVKLFLILIEAIIIATIGQFLAWLFWIVIFRNLFVKKDQRKVKKLKLVSGFEEVIVGGVLLAMMLMPFTSIVNAISNHAELEKEQAEKNETTQMVYAVLDSYQNSLFSKIFFSWTKFDGTETIDTRLASFITQVNYEGIETDLIHELGTFAEVGSGLVNDGLFSAMGTDGMQWALILGTSMLPNAINNILSTDLVQTALPVAMELALNLDDVKSVLGEDTVKWLSDNSVDWNAQLGNVASLYRKLLDADIFDMVLPDTYSQSPIFDLRQLYKVFSSDESQTAFHDAMS
ncbi:MAG: hypothetical protein K6F32_04235, partial [Bacilli bacterium]|nr:hypothetical protein [Bacilli bacterium]